MPTGATGDLPESILHPPPGSLLQLVASRFSPSDTYHHCLSWDLSAGGALRAFALTFTSGLCRGRGLVSGASQPRSFQTTDKIWVLTESPKAPVSLAHMVE